MTQLLFCYHLDEDGGAAAYCFILPGYTVNMSLSGIAEAERSGFSPRFHKAIIVLGGWRQLSQWLQVSLLFASFLYSVIFNTTLLILLEKYFFLSQACESLTLKVIQLSVDQSSLLRSGTNF